MRRIGRLIEVAKKHPITVTVTFLVALLAGVAAVMDNVHKIRDLMRGYGGPEVVAFGLSRNAVGYQETNTLSFADNDRPGTRYRTFETNPELKDASRAVAAFQVTLKNPLKRDLIVTRATYDVKGIGGAMGGPAGPITPLEVYHHRIDYRVGTQAKDLMPPFRIPAESAAAFELYLSGFRPYGDRIGLSWVLRIGFEGDEGTAFTDVFQVFLPASGGAGSRQATNYPPAGQPKVEIFPISELGDQRIPVEHPSATYLDCLFERAGVRSRVDTLDALDKTMMYLHAAGGSRKEFVQRKTTSPDEVVYGDLLTVPGALAFQALVKAQAGDVPLFVENSSASMLSF